VSSKEQSRLSEKENKRKTKIRRKHSPLREEEAGESLRLEEAPNRPKKSRRKKRKSKKNRQLSRKWKMPFCLNNSPLSTDWPTSVSSL
jgi:hypothetical protein